MSASYLILALLALTHVQLICTQNVFRCQDDNTYCLLNTCTQCPSDAPFCNSDAQMCTASNPNPTLICPRDGSIPSLETCRSYTLCLGSERQLVTCPSFTAFNPAIGACQRGQRCYQFLCRKQDEGRYIPYPGDSSLFALCSNRKAAYIRSCQPGEVFDSATARCQQYCPGIGYFNDPNSANCQCYYNCAGIGIRQGMRECCSDQEFFSPTRGQCVRDDGNLPVECAQSTQQ